MVVVLQIVPEGGTHAATTTMPRPAVAFRHALSAQASHMPAAARKPEFGEEEKKPQAQENYAKYAPMAGNNGWQPGAVMAQPAEL